MPKTSSSGSIITRFKGINQTVDAAAIDPAWALDCLNVIVDSESGGLEKFRYPVTLTANMDTVGPKAMFFWENASTKKIVAQVPDSAGGSDTYLNAIDLDSWSVSASYFVTNGLALMSAVLANYLLYIQNGVMVPSKFAGSSVTKWGIAQSATPSITGVSTSGAITLAVGRMYRIAFKNALGDVGAASAVSASSGPVTSKKISLSVAVQNDAQITKARVYSTLDGGTTYFFNEEKTATPNATLTWDDNTTDAALDQSEVAPLYNFPPPIAKYLCKWGSRIFGFNITSEINSGTAFPSSIFYTGYEQILVGRPETSVPLGNRLNLAVGADALAGGGAIAAGLVAFDVTNKMYMYRGQPEDITSTASLDFSLFLQELPWQIGCAAHTSIQSTACGLVWLTPDREVRRFDGTREPIDLTMGLRPIMRRVVEAQMSNARSAQWNVNGRNWYILAVAVDSASYNNLLIFFDLEPNPDLNIGAFPVDVGRVDSILTTETAALGPKLLIGQAGYLKELVVRTSTTNAVTVNGTQTVSALTAYWKSGYVGNEEPLWRKFFRWGRLLANSTVGATWQVQHTMVDDDTYTLASPLSIAAADLNSGSKFSVNKVGRRLSTQINFPTLDQDAAVQQLSMTYEKLSEF